MNYVFLLFRNIHFIDSGEVIAYGLDILTVCAAMPDAKIIKL